MRQFDTGATRDTDENKLDYEGFLSPLVVMRYAQYMHKHRVQADGGLRDADNWQKGMPLGVYMKSLWRHFMDLWLLHRGQTSLADNPDFEEVLCAILFNVMGYLHSILVSQRSIPSHIVSRDLSDSVRSAVLVDEADLVEVLSNAEGFIGGKDNAAFSRLAAAAGCE